MIIVIADDLTGAAEIAGIGLRYSLKTEVFLSPAMVTNVPKDLIVICTDSRSMTKQNAEWITGFTMEKARQLRPSLVYKKIDSVFRGYVLDEIKIEMSRLRLDRALVLAANPSMGRTIHDGTYFIDERPIDKTGFAIDPEFAIKDASVLKMLKADAEDIQIKKNTDELPAKGIIIGEAATVEDITAWAGKADNTTYLAGAADFFTALLEKEYSSMRRIEKAIDLPHLYISGTSFDKSVERIKKIKDQQGCVEYLPELMMLGGNVNDEKWMGSVKGILTEHKKCVIAIREGLFHATALQIRSVMAKAIARIIKQEGIKEMFIEGGATAAAIMQELKIENLVPVNELQRGVVKMKTSDEIYITMKPGSYDLPRQVKELYSVN